MKKNLKRIGIIIFILFAILQNCCFADVVLPTEEQKKEEIEEIMKFGLVLIEAIILIVLMILILNFIFISLKVKKLNETADKELYECKKDNAKDRIYICVMICIIITLICFNIYTEFNYNNYFTYIIIFSFVVSITTRLIEREIFSNIFYSIGLIAFIILITIGATIKIKAEKFNSSFLQYVTDEESIDGYENIDNFVNELIENNKNNKHKITVFYEDEAYEENINDITEQLTKNIYSLEFEYYNYYISEIYIEEYLSWPIDTFNSQFTQYEGDKILGSSTKALIEVLISNASTYSYMAEKIPSLYFYSSDGTDDYSAIYDEDKNDINDYKTDLSIIRTKISSSHYYEVKMSYNSNHHISEITIT